nr:unnamed protein product [Naegleria fowleri]
MNPTDNSPQFDIFSTPPLSSNQHSNTASNQQSHLLSEQLGDFFGGDSSTSSGQVKGNVGNTSSTTSSMSFMDEFLGGNNVHASSSQQNSKIESVLNAFDTPSETTDK